MRKFAFFLLPLFCVHAAAPKELQALADQARALPPEFAADILLKLAASPVASDAKWKRELIEDAFFSAGHAQSPYRKQAPGRIAFGITMSRMDVLTLQGRAVEAMLPLDAQRALVMFGDIAMPHFPKPTCQDAITPNVSAYYETAILLFQKAFTPAQRSKGDDIQFLLVRIAAIESAAQVVPALKMLDQVELSPSVRNELIASFAGGLERMDRGNREFGESENLLVGAAVPEMHETPLFMPALRAYIVRHVSGPRCSDHIKAGELPEAVQQFNKLISRIDPAATQFHPISAEESAPSKDDGTYPPMTLGQSAHFKQILAAEGAIGQGRLSAQEKTARYLEILELLDSWKVEDEASPEDYWFEAATTRFSLVSDVPEGPAPRNVMENLLRFMEQQYDSDDNRGLWSLEFGHVVALTRPTSEIRPQDRAWFLDLLVHSHNPAISLYAQMEKLLGSS